MFMTSGSMAEEARPSSDSTAARRALALLLAINLFNYIDRQILAAVEPTLRLEFFGADDADAKAKTGALATAFLLSYMFLAPVFGWLADRMSRWVLVGISIALWSLASGWSGLAGSFAALLVTRAFVGVGEAGFGPAAPTILSDHFPVEKRGRVMSLFYVAIPVGSALGYVFGGWAAAHWGWRWAFYLVVPPGLALAAVCFFMRDPRESRPAVAARKASIHDYLGLLKIPSFVLNTAAMTAMTFAIGGIAFWIPSYIYEVRGAEFMPPPMVPDAKLLAEINTTFGIITVAAGLLGTILGGWLGDKLRARFGGAYFFVSGIAILCAFPATVGMLRTPFPYAWGMIFLAVFFLFFNTGPANTALANVTSSSVRSTAFALNIFVIHAFGDAISPPLIGWIAGKTSMDTAFYVMSLVMVVASAFWLIGTRYLARDTAAAEESEGPAVAQPRA